mgnify:FL=1
MDNKVVQWVTRSTPLESRGAWKRFVQERKGFDNGGLATPKRGLVDGPGSYSKDRRKGVRKPESWDKISDLFLKTYAEDDISHIHNVEKKVRDQISRIIDRPDGLQHISKQSGLSENVILNLIEDRDAHADLMKEIKTQEGIDRWAKPKKDLDNRMRNWLIKNSKKYADPEKFKKSFNRVFGKNNYISKAIKMDKKGASMLGFVDDNFVKTYISDKVKNPEDFSFSSRQLDDMFKTLIYNNNENVRNKVVKTFEDILPKEKIQKAGAKNVYNAIKNNEFLQKFNLDKGINGPVARLIAKGLDEKLVKQIDLYKKPYFGTRELLNYLGDHVNSKYKSMFKEAEQAVTAMQNDKWSKARTHLDTGREIMFDHKIPSSLIEAGYGDEIEYIKLNPTSKAFNINIKNKQFDQPMNKLVRQFEQARTLDEKKKIHKKMVAKKDAFSKKYGNYLDEVKIILDEKGKLKFTSDAPVVTKQTDLVKMLETSLGQEQFPTMGKKDQIKFLKTVQKVDTSELYKIYQKAGIGTNCSIKPAKKSEGGRIGFMNAGLVDDDCMKNAIEKNRMDLKSNDPVVAANARQSMLKVADAGKKSKTLGTLMRMGNKGRKLLSATLTGVGTGVGGFFTLPGMSGTGSAIAGVALEYALEAGTYDWYMRKGYTHDEAFAETFFPKVVAKQFGVEKTGIGVLEDTIEYIEDKVAGTDSASQRYLKNKRELENLLVEQEQLKDSISQVEAGDPRIRLDSAEGLKDQLSGVNKRVTELYNNTKPGTPDYQSFMTRREKRDWEEGTRAREYAKSGPFSKFGFKIFADRDFEKEQLKSYYDYQGVKPPSPLYRSPLDDKLKEDALYGLRHAYVGTGEGSEKQTYDDYKDIYGDMANSYKFRNHLQQQYLMNKIAKAGGVANMAGGGIAGIRRPHAIPPKSGPMPQGGGLSSMFNRVRKW